MLNSQHNSHHKAFHRTEPLQMLCVESRALANATHPDFHLSPPPFQRCRKKIKHDFVCLPCACGRFILFTHPFIIRSASFRPPVVGLHSATLLLHYFVSFISPTSAPHTRVAPSFVQRILSHCSVALFVPIFQRCVL